MKKVSKKEIEMVSLLMLGFMYHAALRFNFTLAMHCFHVAHAPARTPIPSKQTQPSPLQTQIAATTTQKKSQRAQRAKSLVSRIGSARPFFIPSAAIVLAFFLSFLLFFFTVELEAIVRQQDADLQSCTCRRSTALTPSQSTQALTPTSSGPIVTNFGDTSPLSTTADTLDQRSGYSLVPAAPYPDPPKNVPSLADGGDILASSFSATDLPGRIFTHPTAGPSQVTIHNWPLNIPPPDILLHLVETFFSSVPLAARLIHRPSFMANLQKVPTSPDFPHVALLHAICGIASLFSPIIRDTLAADLDPLNGATASFNSGILYRKFGNNDQGPRYFPRKVEDIVGDDESGFGGSHIRWASAAFRLAMQNGDRLVQLMQAGIICAWYNHTAGRSVNTYSWVGIASRMALPLGLSGSPGFEPLSRLPPHMLSLMPDPKTQVEIELPRNIFWLVYAMERVYTAGTVWPLTISDDDVSQMMPCRLNDLNSGAYVPTQGRQHLFTPKMLVNHPPLMTDAFTLYLKASVLLGKVKTFNVRFKMRYTDGAGPTAMGSATYTASELYDNHQSNAHDPYNWGQQAAQQQRSPPLRSNPAYPYGAPSSTAGSKIDPRETAEFQLLDNLIRSFIASIPREYKDPVPTDLGLKLDPVLYTAHLLPHVAMILLHDPHADIGSPNCLSSSRILAATRSILELIYKLCGTTYDLIYLDHSCSFCWFVAGASLIRFLKAKMRIGDDAEITRITQELGVVRFMLSNLGDRTIVGLRQIKLLDDIYNLEIGNTQAPSPPTKRTDGSAKLSEV
ncbi:hypothetical protein M407DRAFT_27699 [Tulasnella calospora MUT 4182]|uniref:Xylanolytic transcriptional activator regulatory domain-containing protein n=1 Tax=Tulasnella calospora MUT 4182 TaxID=1051891 RepID=A0A0C3LND0_9AGAM|nr:hypothetical protein M407DRAFT_27699 [Tulasnella calospora MUT 4182]